MGSRRERRLLRRQVNHIRDLHRDLRQRTVVAVALAMASAFAGRAYAMDKSSTVYYVLFVALVALTIIVTLAALASHYFYRRAVNNHEEDDQ